MSTATPSSRSNSTPPAGWRQRVSFWGWLLVLALAPVAFFPSAATSPLLLLIPAVWWCRWRQRGLALAPTLLNWPILVMSAAALFSLLTGDVFESSIVRAAGFFYSVAFFFEVVELSRRGGRWQQTVLGAYLAGGVALAGIALLGTDWLYKVDAFAPLTRRLPPRLSTIVGPEGTFHPNIIAGTLLWMLPVLIAAFVGALWPGEKGYVAGAVRFPRWLKVLLSAGYLFTLAVFILLQSRGAYAGLAVAAAAALSIALRRWRHWSYRSLALLALIVLVLPALLVAPTFNLHFGQNAGQNIVERIASGIEGLRTMAGRLELWRDAWDLFRGHPWFGVGLGSFEPVVRANYPTTFPPDTHFVHAHNHLLTVLAELGAVGLIAYGWLWLAASWVLVKRWMRARVDMERILVLGIGAALLSSFVYGLTDTVALGTKPGVVFWFLLGLAVVPLREGDPSAVSETSRGIRAEPAADSAVF